MKFCLILTEVIGQFFRAYHSILYKVSKKPVPSIKATHINTFPVLLYRLSFKKTKATERKKTTGKYLLVGVNSIMTYETDFDIFVNKF